MPPPSLILLATVADSIQHWIAAGGYLVLFGLLFACGLGLPLPEDIPLIIAGALSSGEGMNLYLAGAVGWLGIIGGDIVLYHLGRRYGLEITRLPFVGKHLTTARIEKLEDLFARYGVWVIAIGRLIAGVRGAMVVAAGATRYNFWRFVVVDGIAALISGGLFLLLGYWLGHHLKELLHEVDVIKKWVLLGTGIVAIVVIGWLVFRRTEKTADSMASGDASPPPESPSR